MNYKNMNKEILIKLVDIINNTFSEIRNDWSDPRGFCRYGWTCCDILNSVINDEENSIEKAEEFIKSYEDNKD